MPRLARPIGVREPPYPEKLPLENTDSSTTMFITCAIGTNPEFLYAKTNGEAFVPDPNRFGSVGLTVIDTISDPRI